MCFCIQSPLIILYFQPYVKWHCYRIVNDLTTFQFILYFMFQENEDVVLKASKRFADTFKLVHILPEWKNRGLDQGKVN